MNLEAEFCPESQGSKKAGCRPALEGLGTKAVKCLRCVSPVGLVVSHGCEAHVRKLLSLYLLIIVSVQTLLGLHIPTADEPCSPLKAALGVNAEQQTVHEKCAHAELLAMYRYTLPLTICEQMCRYLTLCPSRGITGSSDDTSYRTIS